MEAFSCFPDGVSRLVLARNPCAAGGVQEVLRAQYVGLKEQLGVLYAAVNVALGREVDNIIYIVFGKQLVGEFTVAYVPVYEYAPLTVNIVFDCAVVAGVS